MKKNNFRKRELSEDEPVVNSMQSIKAGAFTVTIMVMIYLVIVGYFMTQFSGRDIPRVIVVGISLMSIFAYMFGLIEDIKEISPKDDEKNYRIVLLGIFRGVKYAFGVAFAAYAFVFQFFDLPLVR